MVITTTFSDIIKKTLTELAKKKNKAIKNAYNEGYDWIAFKTTMGKDSFMTATKSFKGELKNPRDYDEILDLKSLREQYDGASIEYIEQDIKTTIKQVDIRMKLFKISQNENNGYDTYDSAIVCAENEEEARKIHPADWNSNDGWCDTEYVKVEYIGEANEIIKKGVIVSSYNAG